MGSHPTKGQLTNGPEPGCNYSPTMRIGCLVLALCLLGACSSDSEPTGDQSSLACNHFRNVLGDVQDGVLTDTELREKLKEVESNASIASPGVQTAARQLLAAATSGSSEEISAAGGKLLAACSVAGS